ncbi:MAG: hypothetical protein AAFR75_08520 [Pseudomonadota bacterium]
MRSSPGREQSSSSLASYTGLSKLFGLALGVGALAAAGWNVFAVEEGLRTNYVAAFAKHQAHTVRLGETQRTTGEHLNYRQRIAAVPVARSEDFWLGHASGRPGVPVSFSSPVNVGDELTLSLNGRSQAFQVTNVRPGNTAMNDGHDQGDADHSVGLKRQTVEITGLLPSQAGSAGETKLKLLIEVVTPIGVGPSALLSRPRQL